MTTRGQRNSPRGGSSRDRGDSNYAASKPSEKSDPPADPAADAARWVDEHAGFLYRYALLRVRVSDLAEELVQDTFSAAIQAHGNFAGRSSERTWLCGILKHKIIHHYRLAGRETSFTDMEFLSGESAERFVAEGWWFHAAGPKEWRPEPDVIASRCEFWVTVRDCLGKLPDQIANVFVMRELEEMSTKDICEILSISDNHLWVMLHRARMALRESLTRNWFDKDGS